GVRVGRGDREGVRADTARVDECPVGQRAGTRGNAYAAGAPAVVRSRDGAAEDVVVIRERRLNLHARRPPVNDRVRDVRLGDVPRVVDSGYREAERPGVARVERSSVCEVAGAEENAAPVGVAARIIDGDVGARLVRAAVARRTQVNL